MSREEDGSAIPLFSAFARERIFCAPLALAADSSGLRSAPMTLTCGSTLG